MDLSLLFGYLTVTATLWIASCAKSVNKGWIPFRDKEYLFIGDSVRSLDRTRDAAKVHCLYEHGDLVSIETEDELEFVKDNIRTQVRSYQQQLLVERWWTNGIGRNLGEKAGWRWDYEGSELIRLSALKRETVPRGGKHYLALTHPEKGGWKLKVVPPNFTLRSVCERPRNVTLPSQPVPIFTTTPPSLSPEALDEISQNLRRELFSTYDVTQPPVYSPDKDKISLVLSLGQITDNVSSETLQVKQQMQMQWMDPRLSWSPDNYGGKTFLRTRATDIWFPTLTYARDSYHKATCDHGNIQNLATVNATGEITLTQTCDVIYNCTYQKSTVFPFDHQSCHVMLAVNDVDAAYIVKSEKVEAAKDSGFHSAWRVSSCGAATSDQQHHSEFQNLSGPVTFVQLTLYLHRNVVYHVLTLIVPCLFLSVVLLILLWLPHGSGVKCVATLLVTLAFLLYLLIGGQHRQGRNVSFSDMYMIVISIIGTVSLITQICILRLLRRHQQHLPPPSWVERIVLNRSRKTVDQAQKDKEARFHKKQELSVIDKRFRNPKCIEEKELMLGDQSLGMTSLGRDAKMYMTADNQYITHTMSRDTKMVKHTQLPEPNHKTTSLYSTPHEFHRQHPNGTAKKQFVKPDPPLRQTPVNYNKVPKQTILYSGSRDGDNYYEETCGLASVSGGESFDSGCHSTTKNSPDITMSTTQSLKESQWKKCIVWFDRAVSLVISAAVIFTIMVFTILFLAT